jgi:hypothetical protein
MVQGSECGLKLYVVAARAKPRPTWKFVVAASLTLPETPLAASAHLNRPSLQSRTVYLVEFQISTGSCSHGPNIMVMAPSRSSPSWLMTVLTILTVLSAQARALHLYMEGRQQKCFFEELPKDTLVVGMLLPFSV